MAFSSVRDPELPRLNPLLDHLVGDLNRNAASRDEIQQTAKLAVSIMPTERTAIRVRVRLSAVVSL